MCLSPLNNCGPLQDYRAINLLSYHPTLVNSHWLPSVTGEQAYSHSEEKHKIQLDFVLRVSRMSKPAHRQMKLTILTTEKAISSAQYPNKREEFSWLCLNTKLALEHSHGGGTQLNHCVLYKS